MLHYLPMTTIYRKLSAASFLFVAFTCNGYAQFYDSEDAIYFYVQSDVNNSPYCCVFNFYGDYATFFNYTYQYSIRRVKELLRTDPNYFEKKVRDAEYKMTYTSDYPSESYTYKSSAGRYLLTFSDDRQTFIWRALDGAKVEKYSLVPKSYFLSDSNKTSGVPSPSISASDFYEISETFFYKSGTYRISSFSSISLGLAGVQVYNDIKPKLCIHGDKFTIQWNDGSNSERTFASRMLMLPVLTLSGKNVELPLYKLDNGRAIRAIKMKNNGMIYILEYVFNTNMNKYIHEFSYSLEQ